MVQIKGKVDFILITILLASVFFGAAIGLGMSIGGVALTLFRVVVPIISFIFLYRGYKNQSLRFESLEKAFTLLMAIWFIYSLLLMAYRGIYFDKDAIRELMQLVIQFFIVLSIFMALKTKDIDKTILLICRLSVVIMTFHGIFEIITGIHLTTSYYYDLSFFPNFSSIEPKVATGIFYNENDFCACLALFSPLFFPQANKKIHINALRVLELSFMEFIFLNDDAVICFFAVTVGLVIYSLVSVVKYKWVMAGGIYAYGLEQLIMKNFLNRGIEEGLNAEIEEQFSGVATQTGSAFIRLNTYIHEFNGAINQAKGLGFGPYGINKFLTQFDHNYVLSNPHSLWLEILGNYGIGIFIMFISICIITLGSMILCGTRTDETRAILIPMDIILVIIGFASSSYIGIAYWWIVIGLSVSYATKLLMRKKRYGHIDRKYVAFTITFLILAIGTGYLFTTSNYMKYKFQEPLKPVLASSRVEIHRCVDREVKDINVYLDKDLISRLKPKNGEFTDVLELDKVVMGWHYYKYEYITVEGKIFGYEGYLINKADESLATMIPEATVAVGRDFNNANRIDIDDCGFSLESNKVEYTSKGAYLKPDNMINKDEKNYVEVEETGLPRTKNSAGNTTYDADLVTSYGLMWYSEFVTEGERSAKEKFLNCTEWLLKSQKFDGSVPILHNSSYRDEPIDKGWTSAKTQGKLLSLLSRAYSSTGEEKYLNAGEKALQCLVKQCFKNEDDDNCKNSTLPKCLITKNHEFKFYEDVSNLGASYRLENQLYVLIGLYDWGNLDIEDYSKILAITKFDDGVAAAKHTLPLYDLNGYLAGDLMHFSNRKLVQFDKDYIFTKHIAMLKILSEISEDHQIKIIYDRFKSYLDDEFYQQSKNLIK